MNTHKFLYVRHEFIAFTAKFIIAVCLITPLLCNAEAIPALKITEPIDGAVMHPRLGRVTDAGLEIEIRGQAPAGAAVLINGVPASREHIFFTGTALLTERENKVLVSARQHDTLLAESCLRLPLIQNSFKRYRVVIDDNSFFLRDITHKGYASLFDCFYLKMLKDLHTRYGTKFTLNIYFTTGDDWNLRQFPERYRDEWRANAGWLRLAFHAYADKPDCPYQDAPVEKLLADLDLINAEILRFAGKETFSPVVVIHWGMIRPEAWKPLYDKGARLLGGYFRRNAQGSWIVNYNMDELRSEWLSRHDLLKDYASGIVFSKVDMVINSTPLEEIVPRLDAVIADPQQNEVIDLLTHEQYFWPFYVNYLPDYPQRMERTLSHLTNLGYKPVFLQDEFQD